MSDAVRVIDSHTELAPASVTPDQHHPQSHVHNGADSSGVVAHSALSGIGANDHHARAHDHSNALDGTALTPVSVAASGAIAVGSYYAGVEIADPAAPAANNGRLYWRDSGGVTQLVAQFPTGAIIPLATEGIGTPVPTQIVNGSGSVSVSAPGAITLTPTAGQNATLANGQLLLPDGTAALPSLRLTTFNTGIYATSADIGFSRAGTSMGGISGSGLTGVALFLGPSPNPFASADVQLHRDGAASTLAQRNATNPQTLRLYSTYTDASNYERLRIGAQAAGNYLITPEAAGTGVVRNVQIGAGQLLLPNGTVAAPALAWSSQVNTGRHGGTYYIVDGILGVERTYLDANGITVGATEGYRWGATVYAPDIWLTRDAADTLAQRRGTNAQTLRLYNTYTDASNYERARFAWSSNQLIIGQEKAGTGASRIIRIISQDAVYLEMSGGTNTWFFGADGHLNPGSNASFDIGASARQIRNLYQWGTGRAYMSAPATAPTDGNIAAQQMSWWVDETGHLLTFRVRYGAGTYRTGTVALV